MAWMGRPGLSSDQKELAWQLWRDGQSLSDIGRVVDKHAGSIFGVLKLCGGILMTSAVEKMAYTHQGRLASSSPSCLGAAPDVEPRDLRFYLSKRQTMNTVHKHESYFPCRPPIFKFLEYRLSRQTLLLIQRVISRPSILDSRHLRSGFLVTNDTLQLASGEKQEQTAHAGMRTFRTLAI